MSTKDALERIDARDVALAGAIFGGLGTSSYDAAAQGGSTVVGAVGGGSSATGGPTAVYTLQGEARSDSANGRVLVALGGEATTGDGGQAVEMDCSCVVLDGQQVIVTVTGTHPVVTDVIGWGDEMQRVADAANATAAAAAAKVATVEEKAAALEEKLVADEVTLNEAHQAVTDPETGEVLNVSSAIKESSAAIITEVSENYVGKNDEDYLNYANTTTQTAKATTSLITAMGGTQDEDGKAHVEKFTETVAKAGETTAQWGAFYDLEGTKASDIGTAKSDAAEAKETASEISTTLKSDYLSKSDAAASYQTLSSAKQTSDAFDWSLSQVKSAAVYGEGTDMVRSALDGTPGCAAAWGTGAGITATDSGVRIAGTWGTASAVASAVSRASASWWDASATATADHARAVEIACDVTLNAALDDTALGTTRAEMGLTYLADGATSTTSVYGCRLWLAGKAKGTYAVRGRLTLPAKAAIRTIFLAMCDYGDAVDLTFSDVHWRVSPAGLGGENLMTGTAGFSALTGGTWSAGAVRVSGTATLGHAHDGTCPVPDSDCVTITATKAGTQGGLCQDQYDDLQVGDAVTLSCWVKASRDGSKVRIQPAWNPTSGGTQPTNYYCDYFVGTGWVRLVHTCYVTQAARHSIGYVYLIPTVAGDTLQVCGLKVERGEVASSWSTSPDDLTQHMRYTSSGLELAKRVNGAYSGTRALLGSDALTFSDSSNQALAKYASDGVHLYDAGTEVASFKKSAIELGQNDDTSTIAFCGGKGQLGFGYDLQDAVYMAGQGVPAVITAVPSSSQVTERSYISVNYGSINLIVKTGTIVLGSTTMGGGISLMGYNFDHVQCARLAGRAHWRYAEAAIGTSASDSEYSASTGWTVRTGLFNKLLSGGTVSAPNTYGKWFTTASGVITVRETGLWRFRLCVHGKSTSRIGAGIFVGSTEAAAACSYSGGAANVTAIAEHTVKLSSGATVTPKLYSDGSSTYFRKAGNHTWLEIEYLGTY